MTYAAKLVIIIELANTTIQNLPIYHLIFVFSKAAGRVYGRKGWHTGAWARSGWRSGEILLMLCEIILETLSLAPFKYALGMRK